MTLHITNGDVFSAALPEAGITGERLPWRDVLHEGPVPPDDDLASFNDTRARFIASCGWAPYEEVLALLTERDHTLARAASYREIVLWFEPDLYDQLQLAQVLSRLAAAGLQPGTVTLALTDRPGVSDPEELRRLYAQRSTVSNEQYSYARRAWHAVTASTPEALATCAAADETDVLPTLHRALQRLVEEYPSAADGLSRTERALLHHGAAGDTLANLFFHVQNSEEHAFLGDTVFARLVERLATAAHPLLAVDGDTTIAFADAQQRGVYWNQRVRTTDAGQRVLRGETSAVALNGIDRYVGGVHLHTGGQVWYHTNSGSVVQA